MRPHVRLLALISALVLGLTACGDDGSETGEDEEATSHTEAEDADSDQDDSDSEPEAASEASPGEGVVIVAPVYPLAWIAEEVAPGADVQLLTDAGDDPHDMELTPRSRELIETADVVLYMGDIGYQPQVETAVAAATGEVVSFAEVVGSTALRGWGGHDHNDHDDHNDHNDHDDHDDHNDHDDHDDGDAFDPHAWFDAALMAQATEAVGAALAAVDSDNADAYRDNAAALEAEFGEVDAEIADLLAADCAHDVVIVSHEAYAYLLEPFGFEQEGVSGTGGHGPASPARIAELVGMIQDQGMDHVLAEPVEGRDDAIAVANEAGIEVLDIYSLEVIDDEGLFAQHGFVELLREQAATTATALNCG